MLEKVKLALRITTNAFDSELNDLIDAAKIDLGIAGVEIPVTTDQSVDVIVSKAVKNRFSVTSEFHKPRLFENFQLM